MCIVYINIVVIPLSSYTIMLECWQEVPQNRPTFVNLRKQFDAFLTQQGNSTNQYMDLSIRTTTDSNINATTTANTMNSFTNDSNINITELENHYVDSPTHENQRPSHLAISSSARPQIASWSNSSGQHFNDSTLSPGVVSLPPRRASVPSNEENLSVDQWNKKYSTSFSNERSDFFEEYNNVTKT